MARRKVQQFTTAFGSYTTSSVRGEGGSGVVYQGADESGTALAVKVLDPTRATRDKLKRFKNEILFGYNARHSQIVRILDHGVVTTDAGDAMFCVMPLYDSTLRDLLKKGIAPEHVLPLYGALLDGVEAAHLLGVVHRDLKPENILYDAPNRTLLIADFGVAHFEQEELYTLVETRPHTRLANFLYAAPEQRARGQAVGRQADIYALGLILNEMFTGEIPQGTGYRQIATTLPNYSYLDDLVAMMIRQRSQDRPKTIEEVKNALIARRNDFISRQKLDQLSRTVVPEAKVDDPLIADPIRVVSFEVTGNHTISLKLNQPPNSRWIGLYQNLSGISFYLGHDFRGFPFSGATIQVHGEERYFQEYINQVKLGAAQANREYQMLVEREARERIEARRTQLQAEADAERRRLELTQRLSI